MSIKLRYFKHELLSCADMNRLFAVVEGLAANAVSVDDILKSFSTTTAYHHTRQHISAMIAFVHERRWSSCFSIIRTKSNLDKRGSHWFCH